MHFSELLLEKLDSNLDISKRIRLAKNAFVSLGLGITHKEEVILLWFLKAHGSTEEKEEQSQLIEGLKQCLSSNYMNSLSVSDMQLKAKAEIIEELKCFIKHSINAEDSEIINCALLLIKNICFLSYLRRHPKEFSQLLAVFFKQNINSAQIQDVISICHNVFSNNPLRGKLVKYFLLKSFSGFIKQLLISEDVTLEGKLIHFLQNTMMKKCVFEFEAVFKSYKNNSDINVKIEFLPVVIKQLHQVFQSQCDLKVKELTFKIIFIAFLKSVKSENGNTMFEFFLLMCHLLGIEQKILINSENGSITSLLRKELIELHFEVPNIAALAVESYSVLKLLLECISTSPIDFNETLLGCTYVSWFQHLLLVILSDGELNPVHLNLLSILIDINPIIIETNISQVLDSILSQSSEIFDGEFLESYANLLTKILQMFTKLQRADKFIVRFLHSIMEKASNLDQSVVLPLSFLTEFTETLSILPSGQLLNIMDCLLNYVEDHCVSVLESKKGKVNALLTQVTCEMMASFLMGVRILGHSVPKMVFDSFLAKMNLLNKILARFGASLLKKAHDRDIVRPFLKLSLYWGELQILIAVYTPESLEAFVSRDTTPTDLSVLHSYLDGEQWSVLSERISNFGAGGQCNKLFLKLILQKLRFSGFAKDRIATNNEATAKHIVVLLTSELYKHNIVEELTTKDFDLILNYLSDQQSKLLIEKLFIQLLEYKHKDKLTEWICDDLLMENAKFVLHIFSEILKQIGSSLKTEGNEDFDSWKKIFTSEEFFNEHNAVNHDQLVVLTQFVNDSFSNPKNRNSKKVKSANVADYIEVLRLLPLVHMNEEVRSLAFVCILSLLGIYRQKSNLVEELFQMAYSFLLYDVDMKNLNVGLFIKWLIEFRYFRSETEVIRRKIVERLILLIANTPEGLQHLENLVKWLKKKDFNESTCLEAQVLIHQGLGKCLYYGKRKRKVSGNEGLMKCRKKIHKFMITELENTLPSTHSVDSNEILLRAFTIELKKIVTSKEENISQFVILNLNAFLEAAIKNIENHVIETSSIDFFIAFMGLLPKVRDSFPNSELFRIWNVLKTVEFSKWKSFYSSSTVEEFENIVSDLFDMTKDGLFNSNVTSDNFERCFQIWRIFFGEPNEEKTAICKKQIELLINYFESHLLQFSTISVSKFIHVSKFLSYCCAKIFRTSLVDVCFDVIFSGPFGNAMSVNDFHDVCISVFEILTTVWLLRRPEAEEKIHLSLQLFYFLVKQITDKSNTDSKLSDDDITSLADCAFYMEKWTDAMTKSKLSFQKISGYMIADLVTSFVSVVIYPVIKVHLTNCAYKLLSVADEFVSPFLLRVLSPGCEQVFTGLHEEYVKHYKFRGRV